MSTEQPMTPGRAGQIYTSAVEAIHAKNRAIKGSDTGKNETTQGLMDLGYRLPTQVHQDALITVAQAANAVVADKTPKYALEIMEGQKQQLAIAASGREKLVEALREIKKCTQTIGFTSKAHWIASNTLAVLAEAEPKKEKCPDCKGTGEKDFSATAGMEGKIGGDFEECPTCRGTGEKK